jgi:predicted transcriptional regulator
MSRPRAEDLSRRERQIMDAIYRLEKPSAWEVRDAIPRPPSYTAVRTILTILEEKGFVTIESDGTRYIYSPVVPREEMAKTVIQNVVDTFFGGSVELVVSTILSSKESQISPEELEGLAKIVEKAKAEAQ